ncbi:dihydroorotase [Candidatus Methylacidithermus pantelleriae]|uniref:Dihydroorotase n=1 Tax=Candidatus Methylacidithermus pantelleriae TaxID=2744239 RepID=A0A8J2BPL0_9BACT|nr:dihydroorotase [Candidatus Methylacidithermus pantelleriae]CAF0704555.1 Dihydroorotase [Candidatus Methylacidithermus pantelleriae]
MKGRSYLCIRGGEVIDPVRQRRERKDLYIAQGRIVDPATLEPDIPWRIVEAEGKLVCPGLIDLHVHVREPGQAYKETLESCSLSAASGGFTTIVAMPNTSPPLDTPQAVRWLLEQSQKRSAVRILPTGCLTRGRQGKELAPMAALREAGVVAFTDDGDCVQNAELMRRALEYAAMLGVPVLDHCQEKTLTEGAVMNEGYWSSVLGLKGWPSVAEELMVARDILLAEHCQARVHCQHLSSRNSVRLIREARLRGVPVTAEVTPHHLALTEECLKEFDPLYKVNPPLRTRWDCQALAEAVAEGTISVLATDHAPHAPHEKEVELDLAPFGMIGLSTALGVYGRVFVETGLLSWEGVANRLTVGPARVLGLPDPLLEPGRVADLVIVDPDIRWQVDDLSFSGLQGKSPFCGMELLGKVILTMVEGKIVWPKPEDF